MKVINKYSIILLLVAVFCFGYAGTGKAATAPPLGDAASFAVLGFTTVTNTGNSVLNGDLGLYSGTSITGFYGTTPAQSPGVVTAGYFVHQTDALAQTAQTAATSAYNSMASQSSGCIDLSGQNLGGKTLTPGVYCFTSTAQLTGTLTLNAQGDENAVWIFQIGTALTVDNSAQVVFSNGGTGTPGCNVFWQVYSAATIGTSATMVGTIIANTEAITLNASSTLYGRAISSAAAVTLSANTITVPTCAVAPQLTVVKSVTNDNGGTRASSTFDLFIDGVAATPGVATTTTVGAHTVSETTDSGYTQTFSANCAGGDITLVNGDNVTCTIYNDDKTASLVVTKIVVGGTKAIADFPLLVNTTAVTSSETNIFAPGDYTVSETGNTNYTQTFSGDCPAGAISLALGDIKSCTITNTYVAPIVPSGSGGGSFYVPPVPPLIDLLKTAYPLSLPGGAGLVTYTYTLKNIGTVPVTDITLVGDTCSPIELNSGDTNGDSKLGVTETWVYKCSTILAKTHTNTVVATGWANSISAVDIASATVVVGLPIVPPLIHVVKVPNTLTLPAKGGAVTYTYTVTNPGIEPLSNVTITDDKCTGLPGRVVGHTGDINKNDLLESNESWTFICKSSLTMTTTNTATASGEANGLTAKDYAIATVVVAIAVPGLPNAGLISESYRNSIILATLIIIGAIFLAVFLKKTLA